MRVADGWKDFEVLDASSGERLERWGEYLLVRPDPQVIWHTPKTHPGWKHPNARYHRSSKGGGSWEFFDLPEEWRISYALGADWADRKTMNSLIVQKTDGSPKIRGENQRENGEPSAVLTFGLKPFAFKHTGVFPEQAVNWERMSELIRQERARRLAKDDSRPVRVLNLFAYTGGATCAAAASGAAVTHVDASKGMVSWARENAALGGLSDAPVRWLVDDCKKFVERELRRGNVYDGILMDPPSYGRGPKGEIWKLEESVDELVRLCAGLLSDRPLFFLINTYTTGLAPGVLAYLLESALSGAGGCAEADEIGLLVASSGGVLPCGASGWWISEGFKEC